MSVKRSMRRHFYGKLLVELGREGILDSDGEEAVYGAVEPRWATLVALLLLCPWTLILVVRHQFGRWTP